MNIYFLSNHPAYIKQEAQKLDTYIKRIAFGDLSDKAAVWMKNSHLNQEAFQLLDAVLGLTKRNIPCYQSLLFPEDLLWKDYEHLFVIATPSNLMCMVKLILEYDMKWMEKTRTFPDGMVYLITVEKKGTQLLKNDFKFYYDSREAGN
ncbi:hypothetical protein MCJ35_16100 [Enterocloster sp. OA13]|uniref:hypothetical protein n=1 Tax=Enterocloster sp. OA13 TaxID=2914161 RepID=UPI0012DD93DF|nr:hypothetical protein [Enterocloster sp. OA13]